MSDYTEDFIFGLIWRWKKIYNSSVPDSSIWCFCPRCNTRLVHHYHRSDRPFDDILGMTLTCETCNISDWYFEGNKDDLVNKVKRQVERKAITGKWKDVVRRSKSGKLVQLEEKPPAN